MTEKPDIMEEIADTLLELSSATKNTQGEVSSIANSLKSINTTLEDISYQMGMSQVRREIIEQFEEASYRYETAFQTTERALDQMEQSGTADISALPRDIQVDLVLTFPSCTNTLRDLVTDLEPCGNCAAVIFANTTLQRRHLDASNQKEKKRKVLEE